MARTKLNGCHLYITKYTNDEMDPLMSKILFNKKAKGYLIIDKLNLIIAGGKEGYYAPNSDDTLMTIATRCQGVVDVNDIKDVVRYAIDIGYYDTKKDKEHHIITSRELQLMHFEASVNREETYILCDYSCLDKEDIKELKLAKRLDKLIKSPKILAKNGVSSPSKKISSVSYNETSVSYDEKSVSYSHKEKKRKINKKKQNEINENYSNEDESKQDDITMLGNGNSKSKVKRAESSQSNIKHHSLTEALLEYDLIPRDVITLTTLDNVLFDLNSQYKANNVITAGYSVLQTMLSRNNETDPIKDYVAYIGDAIISKLGNKPVDYASTFEDEQNQESNDKQTEEELRAKKIEELEKLKIARVMKKHKCTFDEAKKIMQHDKEVRKNIVMGDDLNA